MIRLAKILSLVLLIGLSSCYEEEVYSDIPFIEYKDLRFFDSQATDSLVLTFSFTDGGADFGIASNDAIAQYLLYVDSENTIVTEENLTEVRPPFFVAPLLFEFFEPQFLDGNSIIVGPSNGTFPLLLTDGSFFSEEIDDIVFECPDIINQDGSLFDTVDVALYALNPNFIYERLGEQDLGSSPVPALFVEEFYNLIITFERRVGDEYEEISFREEFGQTNCEVGNFNGRVPWFDREGESGTVTYNMQSLLFRLGLGDDIFRIRFFVYDRSGNKSNEAVTPDIMLSEITITQ